ncbi:BEN domain-containing protein 5-like isoform X4 [Tachysurus ichikawai]
MKYSNCSFINKIMVGEIIAVEVEQSGSGNSLQESEAIISVVGDEIVLGGTIHLRKEIWEKIRSSTRDSLFIKELAVAVWGTKTLGERSLTGKECPTTKSSRQPLTPKKLKIVKATFREWLEQKNIAKEELEARASKSGRYITEKIMDINKQKKKAM